MTNDTSYDPLPGDDEIALRRILEGTASTTGTPFFRALVENLAGAVNTDGAWVTEYEADTRRLRALAFWMVDGFVEDYAYDIEGTPCEPVIENARLVHYPDNIVHLFPGDNDLPRFNAVSYMGVPLKDLDGRILGHLAVMDSKPMPRQPRGLALFQIFAARAAAELQRLRAEADVRARETKLERLIDSALDAIVELDHDLSVLRFNPAAEKLFARPGPESQGLSFSECLHDESYTRLRELVRELNARPEGSRYLWVPGGFRAVRATQEEFPAEASLSRYDAQERTFYTLIIRNVNDRIEAERRIQTLTVQTEYLRDEIRALHGFDDIIGESRPMLRLIDDLNQVAATQATVLILGETGTGKEVVARAIHAASRRRDKPLIKVNCAAIPATLIESEFFGHEQGAFTGATKRREGRFALADGGTIFLDEVGELPLDLQSKLLRVLQEGEFEPVGSSQTRRVDVRVIAATNRDLQQQMRYGLFREDLFYRLNVFPLHVPPLRERGRDVVMLAESFTSSVARRIGRDIISLTPECMRRLCAYDWPGNVRELQNVIERAVITSRDGHLNLDRALPDVSRPPAPVPLPGGNGSHDRIRTMAELHELERENIERALDQTDWRVSGRNGAAALLGMKAFTLSSRIKALGIKRPL
ncbi:MAG: sigma 54-interacting transcriptional regulator [candidate division Zixibacteria bacterium]|jgi:PAS domain S-box-containing protein|nr:sigma 54-interacting transcriptional regulator [candidate division Zixibacteria bacterium]